MKKRENIPSFKILIVKKRKQQPTNEAAYAMELIVSQLWKLIVHGPGASRAGPPETVRGGTRPGLAPGSEAAVSSPRLSITFPLFLCPNFPFSINTPIIPG